MAANTITMPSGTPGFLELLVVNLINMYRALMIANLTPSPFIQQLRQEVHTLTPGDLVLEISNSSRPHPERIGMLEEIIPKERNGNLMKVKRLNGESVTLRGAHLIKVPQEVFRPHATG